MSDNNYPKWEPDPEKYGTPKADHFYQASYEKRPRQTRSRRKKNHTGLKIAGALAFFMALAISLAFAGAAVVRGVTSSSQGGSAYTSTETDDALKYESDGSADAGRGAIAEVGLTSFTEDDESGIRITDVSDIVAAVMPSVVSITSRSMMSGYMGWPYPGYETESQEVESGIGSGTIVGYNSEELLILTSYHVVEGCSSLYVTFCDDNSVDGYIKEAAPENDIAIVAVSLGDISEDTLNSIAIATISNSENEIGDGVIVIGNALGFGQSVVTGIVSAVDRNIQIDDKNVTVLQTDAAINAGNSGGCTLNSRGEVIGISEAKISSDAVEGMCYAISIQYYYDLIMEMLNEPPASQTGVVSAPAGA